MPLLILLTSVSHLGEDYAAGEVVDSVAIGMDYGTVVGWLGSAAVP